jgi:hypothetical protein
MGVKAVVEPGTKTGQGHEDQWLGYMSQSGLALEHPLRVGTDEYTLRDLVEQAKYDVYDGKECSWTLIGLATYLPIDEQWVAADGTGWSLERIVSMEAAAELPPEQAQAEIMSSACGGTHRLIGLAVAFNRHRQWLAQHGKNQEELTGGWLAAAERIRWAVDTARRFQHPGGAFSVEYFQRPSHPPDLSARLGASGHTLEFLALALDDEELKQPWITRAALALCELFQQTRQLDLECGALYHAAHGLVLYRQRRFAPLRPSSASSQTLSADYLVRGLPRAHSEPHRPRSPSLESLIDPDPSALRRRPKRPGRQCCASACHASPGPGPETAVDRPPNVRDLTWLLPPQSILRQRVISIGSANNS